MFRFPWLLCLDRRLTKRIGNTYKANLMNMRQSRLRNFHVILRCPSERSHLIDILNYLYLLSCLFIKGNARASSCGLSFDPRKEHKGQHQDFAL